MSTKINEIIKRNDFPKISPDIAVPPGRLNIFLKQVEDVLSLSNLRYFIFGHIGDGRIHVNLLPKTLEEQSRAKELYGRIVDIVIDFGGTISSEHGVGKMKFPYLKKMLGEKPISQMVRVKKALDPHNILSIGNILPGDLLDI